MSILKARRFWKQAAVAPAEGGYTVALDARPLMTPAKAPLIVPTRAAAEAIAAEWEAVEGEIDPRQMPTTRWANSAIDRVVPNREAVVNLLAEYAGSDLLCYRATSPRELVARQAEAWDPPLAWARETLGAGLEVTSGVLPVRQPEAAHRRLRAALEALDAFALAAVHDLVTLSGSLVLGLAVARGAMTAEDAWAASRVDEEWQASQWGRDEEAESSAAARRADFLAAARHVAFLSKKGHEN